MLSKHIDSEKSYVFFRTEFTKIGVAFNVLHELVLKISDNEKYKYIDILRNVLSKTKSNPDLIKILNEEPQKVLDLEPWDDGSEKRKQEIKDLKPGVSSDTMKYLFEEQWEAGPDPQDYLDPFKQLKSKPRGSRRVFAERLVVPVISNNDQSLKCPTCFSEKTESKQVQTRSADEGMTVFMCCLVCGNKWKYD